MVQKNKGYAMVIVLVVILVLFSLSAALTVLINGQISQSTSNFKRITAKYNAEAGIEEGINTVITSEDPELNNPYDGFQGWSDSYGTDQGSYEYNIYELASNNYQIDSVGVYKDREVNIVVEIIDNGYDKSFIYGNQFTINREESLDNTDLDNLSETHEALIRNHTEQELLDLFTEVPSFIRHDPPDLYKQAIINYYYNGVKSIEDYDGLDGNDDGIVDSYPSFTENGVIINEDNVYNNDPNYYVKQDEIFIGDQNGDLFTFEQNQVYHYRGNLTFEAHSQTEEAETYDDVLVNPDDVNPPLIIVDENLIIDEINEIRGFLFLVKGDIIFKASNAAKSKIDYSFLYTEGSVNYYRDKNNESDTPHLSIIGQIIAEENINIKIRKPSTNSTQFANFNWPANFDYDHYMSQENFGIQIVDWQE